MSTTVTLASERDRGQVFSLASTAYCSGIARTKTKVTAITLAESRSARQMPRTA